MILVDLVETLRLRQLFLKTLRKQQLLYILFIIFIKIIFLKKTKMNIVDGFDNLCLFSFNNKFS